MYSELKTPSWRFNVSSVRAGKVERAWRMSSGCHLLVSREYGWIVDSLNAESGEDLEKS